MFENLVLNDWVRILIVATTALGGMPLVKLSLDEKLAYRKVIRPSSFQPPGFVFSIVWTFLYITYAIVWTYIVYVIRVLNYDSLSPEEINQRIRYIDNLFVLGSVLNVSWSIIVSACAVGVIKDVKAGHILSMVVLYLLLFLMFYIAWYVIWNFIGKQVVRKHAKTNYDFKVNDNVRLCGFFIFLYCIWMYVAFYLSFASLFGY